MADANETWRQIPPEEKFNVMARAQAKGVSAALGLLVCCGTIAIGLHANWVFWGGLAAAPFVYQFFAARAWRDLKPRMMLEYLAAKSAARRFAFTINAKDLGMNLLFKGALEKDFGQDNLQESLEAAFEQNQEAAVWIALFNDAVVAISEQRGGAQLEFGHLIDDKLSIVLEDTDERTFSKTVYLSSNDKRNGPARYRITSAYPAALMVFEKKILSLQAEARTKAEKALASLDALP